MSSPATVSRREAGLWALVTLSEPAVYIGLAEACYQARGWLLTPEAVNYSRMIQALAFTVAFVVVRWHTHLRPSRASLPVIKSSPNVANAE